MIILAEKLITLQHGMNPISNGALVLCRGIIRAVGPAQSIIRKHPHHRVHVLKNAVIMPGLVNAHAHLEIPSLLKTVHADSFPDWVLNLIAAKRLLSSNNYAVAARLNVERLIQTGTTTVGEICTHNISPDAIKQSGMRAVIFYELISMGHSSQFPRLPPKTTSRSSLIQAGLSPHSPYTVSEPWLHKIVNLTNKKKMRIAMHIAESRDEVALLQQKRSGLEKLYRFAKWDLHWAPRGSSPIAYLKRIGFLSPHLLAVHAVQATNNDLAILKRAKTSVAHCPRSNNALGVGKMPLKQFLDAGITVGLGTDSLASVPSLSMWDEMRYAYQIHHRDGISADDILQLATIGGAQALGLDNDIGTLEPGKRADIIAVPLPKKNIGDLSSDLLRETKSCIMTMVNGKILYRNGDNNNEKS